MHEPTRAALRAAAEFFDRRAVGSSGPFGFRRSTDLSRLRDDLDLLLDHGVLDPGRTKFVDLGCGDGRVSLFLGYLAAVSIGVEIEDWVLDEHPPLREGLEATLARLGLPSPPGRVHLVRGDATESRTWDEVRRVAGVGFEELDVFYTYLLLHEEHARAIAAMAKPGALYLVNGLGALRPSFDGLVLEERLGSRGGGLVVYRKP